MCQNEPDLVRNAGNLCQGWYVQPDMSPEDCDALIEAGYDPDDIAVQHRMMQVERGLKLLRQRWHTQPEVFARRAARHRISGPTRR